MVLPPQRLITRGDYIYDKKRGFELDCIRDFAGDSLLKVKSVDDAVIVHRADKTGLTVFKKGERSQIQLPYPLHLMSLKLLTTNVEQHCDEDGMEVRVRYSYNMPKQPPVTCAMTIRTRPAPGGEGAQDN